MRSRRRWIMRVPGRANTTPAKQASRPGGSEIAEANSKLFSGRLLGRRDGQTLTAKRAAGGQSTGAPAPESPSRGAAIAHPGFTRRLDAGARLLNMPPLELKHSPSTGTQGSSPTARRDEMLKEFKNFLLQTNALALAVGVIIGGAVGKVVSSLVADVLMPVISLAIPGGSWRESKFVLSSTTDAAGKTVENAITIG